MDYPRLIKLDTVIEITTLSVPTIYRLMKKGQFPRQIMVSERSARWSESEVLEYINEKLQLREES
jgi:prophage regulatory protein